MNSLYYCIAVAPLAMYLLMLGFLNLRRQPFLTTGARDAATLGIGIAGLVVAGPMELFFPEGASSHFGPWVWLMMTVFYGLCIALLVLLMKPRLVVYNISLEELRPVLTQVAMELDSKSRWLGDALVIPQLKIHMHIEAVGWLRNVQMVGGGNQQSIDGWLRLEKDLGIALRKLRVESNLIGAPFVVGAALLTLSAVFFLVQNPDAVVAALQDMLRT